ncbi:hypothetical protein BO71DRAFT_397823 [Aspergillus ellipticus CBS 707.79]|uniref:Uncharacterized protein n=1 Tax=Aspergillus ellipticus CBS 707.79 TaxID=1448320 RepID=A0A319DDT7_9EURO|nr:hypothetical protein BO71DRAFT_397823 [Aspergillus ellipticus CBS 707.79]
MGKPNDLPPSYEETIASGPLASSSRPPAPPVSPPAAPLPPQSPEPDSRPVQSVRAQTRDSCSVMLTPALSQDPTELYALLTRQARIPPRPYLSVRGTHDETRHDSSRKENRSETVVDFHFKVDLSGYVIREDSPPQDDELEVELDLVRDGWHTLSLVRDNDGHKAYRGGRTKSETWPGHARCRRSRSEEPDSESAELVRPDENGPGLMGWCERFCDDPSPVKSFAFSRSIVGFDSSILRSSLNSHLRSLQYQGKVDITIHTENKTLTVYSPHWVNRMRNSGLVFWVCILLQLWIIAWPAIWFLERHYDVVRAVWYSSRQEGGQRHYACYRDEAGVAEALAPLVTQAALERRQDGRTLTAQEVQLLDRLGRERQQRGVMMISWDRFSPWGRDH